MPNIHYKMLSIPVNVERNLVQIRGCGGPPRSYLAAFEVARMYDVHSAAIELENCIFDAEDLGKQLAEDIKFEEMSNPFKEVFARVDKFYTERYKKYRLIVWFGTTTRYVPHVDAQGLVMPNEGSWTNDTGMWYLSEKREEQTKNLGIHIYSCNVYAFKNVEDALELDTPFYDFTHTCQDCA